MRPGNREVFIFITVLALSLIGLYVLGNRKDEGFDATTDAQHAAMVARQQAAFNPVSLALAAANTQGNLPVDTRALFGTTNITPTASGIAKITASNPYPQLDDANSLYAMIKLCEAVTTVNPSAFNDPKFAENCGICVDIGTNSEGKPATGGLVLLPKEKEYAKANQLGDQLPNYKPTIGTCPAKRLAANAAEVARIQNIMKCQKAASYDITGCAQCYSDQSYFPIDTTTSINPPAVYVAGNGNLNWYESGIAGSKTVTLSATPTKLQLQGSEATRLTLNVSPIGSDTDIRIAGYLQGITSKGTFTVDLQRIVQNDGYSGRKPRLTGPVILNSVSCNTMSPGFGQTMMNLNIPTPFTFVDTNSMEAEMCSTGPFVTKQSSAEFLDSDPCYKKGTGPGKYVQECLQNSFYSNGCLDSGKGFPNSTARNSMLMTDSAGNNRSIAQIAEHIYENAIRSATGLTSSGRKLSVEDWSAASVFCTGRVITSPCDTANKDVGPLSTDCLSYLYSNQGNGKPVGATYTIAGTFSSLFSNSSDDSLQFCTTSGKLSPINASGQVNQPAIEYWKKQGGVARVKALMNEMHRIATLTVADPQKQDAVMNCYGKVLAERPLPPSVAATTSKCAASCGTSARRISILQSPGQYLHFSQIAVIDSTGMNVALGKAASVQSTWPGGDPQKPVDGVLQPRSWNANWHIGQNQTSGGTWNLDLGTSYDIVRVVVYQRTDCCRERINGAVVSLIDTNGSVVAKKTITSTNLVIPVDFRQAGAPAACKACDTNQTKNQVFWMARGNGYSHTKADAEGVCKAVGATNATYAQVQAAQAQGADVCATGWVKDYNQAIYPISAQIDGGCGNGSTGIKTYTPGNNLAGAWCFGVKPLGDSIEGDARKLSLDAYRPYYIRNFDATRYSAPDVPAGSSI